ncbi:MAG: 3'-5' exonuclease [Candidatus Contendobacter sp.]|nr:MAG: 3'-5' exonuclease [Candidatus Contendobacter sp.]
MEMIAVIDFETTGLWPDAGARATEIAVVRVREGSIVDRYQSLMNAGVRIPPFIESLTGITDAMIRRAPPAAEVMRQAADFIGDLPLVAHHAAFDRKVLDAELARIHQYRRQEFACTVRLARRLYPDAPNHKLGTLREYARLPVAGRAHRAEDPLPPAGGRPRPVVPDPTDRAFRPRSLHRTLPTTNPGTLTARRSPRSPVEPILDPPLSRGR